MLLAPRFWYKKAGLLSYLLSPLAVVYQIGQGVHHRLYRFGVKKRTDFSVPIIVVGNLTVGGVGKTPFVIWLAQWLKEQGFRPGMVSRGYGGTSQGPCFVNENSEPTIVGDEAILLAKKTQCPIVVAKKRVKAVETLLAECECDVIISDDGLQHYALGRAIEIVIMDAEHPLGNGFCLPAGPLRESKNRLNSVDFIIYNRSTDKSNHYFDIQIEKIYQMTNSQEQISLQALSGKYVHAVAGIGQPERFFQQLQSYGLQLITHVFPDHYAYQPKDLIFNDDLPVLMTEKDAVKCNSFARENYWCVPISLSVSSSCKAALRLALGEISAP